MEYHRGRYIQRGRGIGSILSSFFRTVFPIVKSIGSSILKSPVTKEVLSTAKNSAIDAGLNIAADALSGENVADSMAKHAGSASKKVGISLRPNTSSKARSSTTVKQPPKISQKRRSVTVKKKGYKKVRKTEKRSDIYDQL
jgi:hypothetical protein